MNKKILELLQRVVFHNEDATYRFSKDDFKELWDAIEQEKEQ